MIEGPTGGGRYAKPLKLYLALNAILMLVVFLRGGLSFYLESMPADVLNPLLQEAGKSRDAFMSDADGWMSLVAVPIMAPLYALAAMPLAAEAQGIGRGAQDGIQRERVNPCLIFV